MIRVMAGGPGRFRAFVVAGLVAFGLGGASAAAAASVTLYAYPAGAGQSDCEATASDCSLSAALAEADQDAGASTVTVTLEPAPSASGPQVFYGNWTLQGATTNSITLNGNGQTLDGDHGTVTGTCETGSCDGPVLTVFDAGSYTIEDLTIQNADDTPGGGGGGGLQNDAGGTVQVTDATFSNDQASGEGGAIDTSGMVSGASTPGALTVSDSTFSDDAAGEYGGAISNADNEPSGSLAVSGSTFTDDQSGDAGGAILNAEDGSGSATVSDSTFSGDQSFAGGAIENGTPDGIGTLLVSDSTFTDDTATGDGGGAIMNGDEGGGSLSVWDSTFSGNTTTGDGGNIDNADRDSFGASVWVAGDVFAGGCTSQLHGGKGAWYDVGDNVVASGDLSCLGGSLGTGDQDPAGVGLAGAGLAANGAPSGAPETIALEPSSAAVGIVPANTQVTLGPATTTSTTDETAQLCAGGASDERGLARPGNGSGSCDAGAFELQGMTRSRLSCLASVPLGQSGSWCSLSTAASGVDAALTGSASLAGSATFSLYASQSDCTGLTSTHSPTITTAPVSAAGSASFSGAGVAAGNYWIKGGYGGQTGAGFTFQPSADTSCPELTVLAPATSLATALTGGGSTGASLTVTPGTAVSDSATVSGSDASAATGTITYTVYATSACTTPVAGGTTQTITTPGKLPASAPVTLSTSGTYYWRASYSGDPANQPSSSACGAETETVAAAGHGADLAVSLSAPSQVKAGIAFSVTVAITDNGPQAATNVATGLLIPRGVYVVAPGLPPATGSELVVWTRSSLTVGQKVTYTVELDSQKSAAGNPLLQAVVVSLSTADPNLHNNTVTDPLTIAPAPAAAGALRRAADRQGLTTRHGERLSPSALLRRLRDRARHIHTHPSA